MAEQRYDLSRLASPKVEKLPTGGVRVPARFTRVGVLDYRQPDGSVRREFRPAEEVFNSDSLASLQDAPIIDGHAAMVNPDNYKDLTLGHVSGTPKADGRFVAAKAVLQAKDVLTRVDSDELCEFSCGYSCDLEPTPGEFEGQRYDAIQRNIRYNHVGMGPRNWGRAGNEVSLRLDGGVCDNIVEREAPKVAKCRFDGKEYDRGSDEHIYAIEAKAETLLLDCKTAQTRADSAEANLVAEKTAHDKTKTELAAANDQKRIDSLVAERVELIVSAGKVLGDVKFDGKSNRDIMADVVKTAYPDQNLDGKSEDYVCALFEHAVKTGVRADSIEQLPGLFVREQAEQDRQDSAARAKQPEPAPWAMSK